MNLHWKEEMYCIYTDNDVSHKKGNFDHVIPLALGGTKEFAVWSEKRANSVIGSQIEGALARDPLVEFALRDSGLRGHAKKGIVPRWKKVTMDGNPIQIAWGSEKVQYWDAKQRRELETPEFSGKEFQANLNIKLDSCYRFVAKVGLGGGYFLYGDDFREAIDCDILRALVFSDFQTIQKEDVLRNSAIRICDRFHPDSNVGRLGGLYRALCENLRRSIFISVPHQDAISCHVGVAGLFIGTMIVPAKTEQLPNDGEHDLGHAIILGPGSMQRLSFRNLVQEFERAIYSESTPEDK